MACSGFHLAGEARPFQESFLVRPLEEDGGEGHRGVQEDKEIELGVE